MMKHYHVKRGRFTFSCTIDDEGVDAWRIFFGGRKDCVTIYVQKDTSIHIATLGGVNYNEHCVEGASEILPRGYTIMMVKTALSFVMKKFKHVDAFEFIDANSIVCARKVRIPLNTFYIAKTGKTWYESKFGAYIENKRHWEEYRQAIKRLNSITIDDLPNLIENYVKRYRKQMLKMNDRLFQSLIDTLETEAKKHSRIIDLIRYIVTNHDCLVADKWLDAYMHDVYKWNFDNTLWIIPRAAIDAVDTLDIKVDKVKKRVLMDGGGYEPVIDSMEDLKRVV
jgi:hypothetical protein